MQKSNVILNKTIYIVGALMSLFHIVALVFYPLPANIFRTVHLMFVLTIIYLTHPSSGSEKAKIGVVNIILLLGGLLSCVYIAIEMNAMLTRGGIWTTNLDIILGIILVVVVLEATRRTNGLALPLIAVAFIVYGFLGQYIPGMLGHKGYSLKRIITTLFTYDGIFGTALDTAATYVVMFVIFAAFLEKTGAGNTFLDLAKAVAGRSIGGVAKMAVIACALFGTISGSAVACVAGVGSIIVPLMMKMNYSNLFSASVISSASIGAQIMPPIMASGAFLMAEFLGVPFLEIIKAAFIPALLYFFTIWISIDANARKLNLRGLTEEEVPRTKDVLKKDGLILLPLVLLVILLVVFKLSAITCAFYSMVASIAVCYIDKNRDMSITKIIETLASSAKGIASVACACACAGIVIGIINLTGLGLKISTLIISVSGGRIIFGLLLSMITAIIFGMGLPTTVSYLLCVSVLAPVLIEMGVLPLAAHMFIFYFACLSGITPPVALAAYTGASLAGTNPITTATESCKLAIIAFFIPYMFVYNNAFLMQGNILQIGWAVIVGVFTCYSLSAILQGWYIINLNKTYRFLFLITSVLLLVQNKILDTLGIISFIILSIVLYMTYKKRKTGIEIQEAK
jgi:TRAP transporter 4TM/12TM fusion protein